MSTVVGQGERERTGAPGVAATPIEAIEAATRALADGVSLPAALAAVARAAAETADADVVVARVADPDGRRLTARAVHCASAALAAELEGTRLDVADVGEGERDETSALPAGLAAAARRARAAAVLQLPVVVRGRVVGTLELMRAARPFDARERRLARLAAAQLAAAIRTFERDAGDETRTVVTARAVELAASALAAGADDERSADELVRLASDATGARRALLWRADTRPLELVAAAGAPPGAVEPLRARAAAALARPDSVVTETDGDDSVSVVLQLGKPPAWVLQLELEPGSEVSQSTRGALAAFAVRAYHLLRAHARARALATELERTRALHTVAAQATADLSLARAVEIVAASVGRLLGDERVAVYLREDSRLRAAAATVSGPHTAVAERLLELALARFRPGNVLVVPDAAADRRLRGVAADVAAARIEAAVAVPLVVPDDVIGLLAVYPRRGRELTENESELIGALAAQLSVALQNARLHEQATSLGAELEEALQAERHAAKQLRALYEISHAFAQSLSLEATLEAVARTIVELLDVDAAVIRMPDARGELLVPRAVHVADSRLVDALGAVLSQPQPVEHLPGRRLFRMGKALVLDPHTAGRLGAVHQILVPFLEKGSTAVVLPIATPSELLGTLTLLSLDRERPITEETTTIALSVAAQAALALDNARLYQQQKEFADTMQRSLLPRSRPEVAGLDVGPVYESSAHVDVGGDVYDFMTLPDGRLAVVLGDVTGHGIDAAADMAMAKFVFRSLARDHREPGAFLAAANAVVCGEVALGKFVTMLYVVVDGTTGRLECASAGHPQPRLVPVDGPPAALAVGGVALGIDPEQEYETVTAGLEPGAAVLLYTDGVIEARRAGELYGTERLDAVLAETRHLAAQEIAAAVLADCRSFSRGDLADDCALVVIKRTAE